VKTVGVIVVLVILGFAYQSFHQDTASGVQCPARSSRRHGEPDRLIR